MKFKISASVVMAVALLAVLVSAGDKAWFDMDNCAMCKNFKEFPDMMNAMTWEQHKISNGFMSISTVPAKYLEDFRKANAKCDALGQKMMAGEKTPLCGSCEAFDAALKKGAAMEQIEIKNGSVMLMTSSDAAVVADLHKWVDRNDEEIKKMTTEMDEEE